MANKKLLAISAVLLTGMILAACNLPASTEPPPIDQSSAQTAAAETIVAQLTEVAETLVPTEPGGSPPEATQTAVISAATETTEPTSPPPATATEAAASPTMTATSPPPPTPTLDADDPKAGLGEPDFFDDFSTGESWPLYADDHVSFNVKDSNLVMTALNPDKYNGWMLTWPVISDYYLEITAKTQQCSGKDTYGNMVRAVKTDKGYIGYLYNISCDGHYSLRRWNGEQYVSLVDWTPSDQINSGANQTNRIGLMVNGSQFTFYANGKQIGQIQDDTHMEGRFGVVIGSANTPDLTVRLDEIAVWNLP
jgi:hypothetical protein